MNQPVLAMLNQPQVTVLSKAAAVETAFSEEIKPVEVSDVESGAFKAMLAFIYADDLSGLNGDNAISVLYAGEF
uniref:BTB domain-containing protein n=1 Tax=Globodera rostochiensis TaxID=31243 RepID=A0A914H782_GLORO